MPKSVTLDYSPRISQDSKSLWNVLTKPTNPMKIVAQGAQLLKVAEVSPCLVMAMVSQVHKCPTSLKPVHWMWTTHCLSIILQWNCWENMLIGMPRKLLWRLLAPWTHYDSFQLFPVIGNFQSLFRTQMCNLWVEVIELCNILGNPYSEVSHILTLQSNLCKIIQTFKVWFLNILVTSVQEVSRM